ncbi:uncharacterized protein LOC142169537 [Nicotiana tabacum]|uniref:Uncharacterized protein LOC142169537 n=1 Tax=Nicotiana tabacum TaxID=4097 RepID=A0AC58SRC0_TOBAC
MAEYKAWILVIRMAIDMNIKELLVIGDSDLLIQKEFTDALATLSSMIQHPNKNYIDPIEVEIKDQDAYYIHVNEEPYRKPWEVLYRRTPDLGLLRCVDAAEATRLLEEIHAATCGPHMKGFTWILLDDYGKRQHPLYAQVSPVPYPQRLHLGSAK